MKSVILNGKKMTSIKAAHDYISRKLDFPEYYGGNLDALWDILSTISDPIHISLTNKEMLCENLGEYSHSLLSVFLDASEENENFRFEII